MRKIQIVWWFGRRPSYPSDAWLMKASNSAHPLQKDLTSIVLNSLATAARLHWEQAFHCCQGSFHHLLHTPACTMLTVHDVGVIGVLGRTRSGWAPDKIKRDSCLEQKQRNIFALVSEWVLQRSSLVWRCIFKQMRPWWSFSMSHVQCCCTNCLYWIDWRALTKASWDMTIIINLDKIGTA